MEVPRHHNRRRIAIWKPSALFVLIAAVLAVSLAVAGLAGRVNPLVLAGAIAAFLGLSCFLALTIMARAHRNRTQWHNVMPCYLSIQDRDLNIIGTNAMFDRDFGKPPNRGSHTKCYQVYKHADEPCENCPVLATFEDGEIHTSREKVVMSDGEVAAVVVTSAPQYDEHGKIASVVEMSTNITELLTLQRELALARTQYQKLFDLVPGYIVVMDQEFRVVETNEAARRDFGEPENRSCFEYFKRRKDLCPGCITKQSFEDMQVHQCEALVTTLDGDIRNLVAYSMPIPDANGEVTRVMEVATDITRIKKLESELTTIGKAVAGMAHRIKNILMGLEGGLFVVGTALGNDDKAGLDQGWEMVERNVDRVSHIVKDLLYCSKEREADFADDVAIGQIASDVCELFFERVKKDEITLQLETTTVSPRRLDPDGIHSLITNLVTNAVDACRFDPDESKTRHTIRVAISCDEDDAALIEVADDGEGIGEDVAGQVFENFFSTKGTAGTGLGLLIIDRVVKAHAGTVTWESTPGRGTTFRVTIPRVRKQNAGAADSSS